MKNIIIHQNLTESKWLGLREKNINSSEVAALFGMSPYFTHFELWNIKAGEIDDGFSMNDRVRAGQYLEPAIGAWAADELGVEAQPFKDYYEDTEARTGASFDWIIPEMEGEDGPGIMEVKNVDFLQFKGSFKAGYSDRKWNDDHPDNILAPLHVEIQIQHQFMSTGFKWGFFAVLVGGNDLRLIRRERREDIIEKIEARIVDFWKSIDENRCPEPDEHRDHDVLKRLYAVSDPCLALDDWYHAEAMDAIALAAEHGERKRAAEKEEKAAKARLMAVLGDVELAVLPDGSKVSWKSGKRGRTMRITPATPEGQHAVS